MKSTDTVKARVSADIKRRVKETADREFLSESAWLKRLVLRDLQACDDVERRGAPRADSNSRRRPPGGSCGKPMLVRLRTEDRLLLDAKAEARGMRPATYTSVLLRSHLRNLAPLPQDELLALKRSIGELAAIGKNINQIAKKANEGDRLPTSVRDDFRKMLEVCKALRDNTKALLKSNVASWSTGHAEPSR